MKRWLVTGGLGFIGSNFIRLVLRERSDVEIINFDAMTYAGNPENCADYAIDERYQFVKGDICDAGAVEAATGANVDAIINFAAETHVDRSILDPASFLRTDVLGTHILLEAARSRRVDRFVQVSTDEVYGDVLTGESSEADTLLPRSPYSASKAGAELQVRAYWCTFGLPTLITRGSNTYGPYQYPEKLIPLFITNLLDAQPVPVYGNGLQIRDWLHVEDHARGILHVLEHGKPGEAYNIGANNLLTNLDIAGRLLESCCRERAMYLRHVADREGHDTRYAMNTSKIRQLGWQPKIPFERGLHETVDWYKRHQAWWRPLKSGEFQDYYKRQYAHR